MIVKTIELTGLDLDWAVYQCEHLKWEEYYDVLFSDDWCDDDPRPPRPSEYVQDYLYKPGCDFKPSSNWAYGGPILEREGVDVRPVLDVDKSIVGWVCCDCSGVSVRGGTLLAAAMRCYVLTVLGNFVDTEVVSLPSKIR